MCDTRSSKNWTEMFWKRIREVFNVECLKIDNLDQEDLILPERTSQNEIKKLEKQKISYRSWTDEVLNGWILNSLSGTQDVLKVGQKRFERRLEKVSTWNAWKS